MNKPAWTTTLFLKVNTYIGRWPLIDKGMTFAAHYLLFVLMAILVYEWWRTDVLLSQVVVFVALFGASFGISYAIALIWYRPRPVQELIGITILIKTLGTWKSFPSDHTISATLVAYGAFLTFSGVPLVVFCVLAASIAVSRVWVGVHYPRDILGGFLVASCVIGIAQLFLG